MKEGLELITARFCFAVGCLWTFGVALAALLAFSVNEKAGHCLHRLWGRVWCWLMGIHVVTHGRERLPGGGVILAPNHESMFDILVLAGLDIDFKWISKTQMGNIPIMGWVMRMMGCYFVRRDHSEHDVAVMKKVERDLQGGISIAIFPEGTRTRTGEMLPIKKGPFRIAQNSGVPLLPIGIHGTWAIAPAHRLPVRRGHRVTVRVGKLFYIPPSVDLSVAIEEFRAILIELRKGTIDF